MNYNLLVHVDDNDPKRLNLAFNNAANYYAALEDEDFKVVMVVNGPAVQLFTRDNAEQAARGAQLAEAGLSIRLCRNALNTFGVSQDQLWECCEVIPAGVVEVVKLQREGFAYLRP